MCYNSLGDKMASDIYFENKEEIIKSLKVIWNYMNLNQKITKCDIIIGCGCTNLEIPTKCAQLYHEGYAPKILFVGGYGKITKNAFKKPEALLFKEIALKEGVNKKDIYVETKSTNTGDNFKNALKIIKKYNLKANKVLIVHNKFNERRTISCAKTILKDKELYITSPDSTFKEFIKKLESKNISDVISNIVGDIERIMVYPEFGWQVKNKVPKSVLNAYNYLISLGFTKFLITPKQLTELKAKA